MEIEKRNELAQAIRIAFADTTLIGGAGAYFKQDFDGKHWSEVSPVTLFRWRYDMYYFSIEAFRYYLPAFLLGVVLHSAEVEALCDTIVGFLTPSPDDQENEKYFFKIVHNMSVQERKAVYAFLSAYRELEPHGSWSILEDTAQGLDRAIEFWRELSQSPL